MTHARTQEQIVQREEERDRRLAFCSGLRWTEKVESFAAGMLCQVILRELLDLFAPSSDASHSDSRADRPLTSTSSSASPSSSCVMCTPSSARAACATAKRSVSRTSSDSDTDSSPPDSSGPDTSGEAMPSSSSSRGSASGPTSNSHRQRWRPASTSAARIA
jgi:hypothetical protein